MTKPLIANVKSITFLLLILSSIMLTFSLLPEVKAETKIIAITPLYGKVGTTVQLIANISTVDGMYRIRFDEYELLSGNATGNNVTASFNVPHTFEGDHTVMIVDAATGENDSATFTVVASYSLETEVPKLPAQRQEGDHVKIFVNVTGGKSNSTYVANITVVTLYANLTYGALKNITTTPVGDFYGNLTYPNDFSAGANTNFTGEYRILFNTTLATETFFIGLTNSTEYHRFQTVDIKAVYKPRENVTLTISGMNMRQSENVTADSDGVIHYTNWAVPSNASIGTYTINITSISPNPTMKTPADTQKFSVPGFDVNITARNRAGEPVANVVLEAFEYGKPVASKTSDLKGLASIKLEVGNYSCLTTFKDHEVGNFSIKIVNKTSLDFYCNLTNLAVIIMDEDNNYIPFADVYVTPENQTFSTNVNGTLLLHSLLPNLTYVLNASRYATPFNTTIIQQLPLTDWFNITIICPAVTLQVNVTDIHGKPLNVTMKVQELMGGLFYHETTANGKAILNCTFGRYIVQTYAGEILLNETAMDLFENQKVSIVCKHYGLTVSVKIVDCFGQPIPNANIELHREGLSISPKRTESNGIATFSDLISGNLSVNVYLADQTQPCVTATYSIERAKTIEIRIGKYVALAGFLIETGQFTTLIIMIAAVILAFLIEVFTRKRLKSEKSPS